MGGGGGLGTRPTAVKHPPAICPKFGGVRDVRGWGQLGVVGGGGGELLLQSQWGSAPPSPPGV